MGASCVQDSIPPGSEGSGSVQGRGLVMPTGQTLPSVADVNGAFFDRVEASPIGQGLSALGSGFPTGGTCPFGSIELPFGSVSMEWVCGLWESVGGIIRSVAFAVWALAGVFIIASA